MPRGKMTVMTKWGTGDVKQIDRNRDTAHFLDFHSPLSHRSIFSLRSTRIRKILPQTGKESVVQNLN